MSDSTPSFRSRWSLVATTLLLVAAACDCDKGSTDGGPCTVPADCDPGFTCTDDRCTEIDPMTEIDSSVMESLDSISIAPDPVNLTLDVGTADSSTVFTVTGHLTGGGTITITNATFTTDVQGPGIIDPSGRFFANGVIGGTVVVTARVDAANGMRTATATIHIALTSSTGGGDSTDPNSPIRRFTDNTPVTDTAADAEILYPLNGAVMPQNVQPADVQWACAGDGTPCGNNDMFRVRITKPNLTVTQYVDNTGGSPNDHFLVGQAAWRAIAQTDPDDDATIVVDRWQSASSRVVAGTSLTIRFAKAAITGTVYYWDIDDETIRAIDDSTSTSRILLPHIDSPAGAGDGDTCVGCHSVSPSGRYMLANTNFSNYGAIFDLTAANLSTANPTPYVPGFTAGTSDDKRWRMSTWSPDETRAMVSTANGNDNLRLIDPFTAAEVTPRNAGGTAITLPTAASHPAWARDNSAIAYVGGINSWAGDTTTGNLRLLPVIAGFTDRFGTDASLVLSSALNGATEVGASPANHGIFYPTWSPDSAYIAFAHGTSSRSDPRDADGNWSAPARANTSALYLVRSNGTGRIRLTRGCAASAPEADPGMSPGAGDRTGLDFQPNFSPFEGGGYYWLSFLSRRPYGNRISGNRRTTANYIQPGQIWVMAIHVAPDGSVDPSEVAYWIPGQDPTHRAVSAFWAPRACRQNGEGCGVGSECCGGDCRPPVGGGPSVCAPPPPEQCRMLNETCATREDCCDSAAQSTLQCAQNVCAHIIE